MKSLFILGYFILFSKIVLSESVQLKDTTKFSYQYNYGFQFGYNYRNVSEFSLGLNFAYSRNMYNKKKLMYIISYDLLNYKSLGHRLNLDILSNQYKKYKPHLGLLIENTAFAKLNSGLRIGLNYYHFVFISYQYTLPLLSDYDRVNYSIHSILINIKLNFFLIDSMLITDNQQNHWNDR